MKDSIVNVLEDFEKLAYKILMWFILVPKTVIKVVIEPGFVPGYVRGELASEKGKQFDEYISPMLLYLGVTLLPAIAIYLLPAFGMEVISPNQDPALFYDAYYKTEQGIISVNDPSLGTISPVFGVEQQAFVENPKFAGHQINLRAELRTRADTSNQFHTFVWKVWKCGTRNPYCSYDEFYYGEWHDEELGTACIYGTAFEGGENRGCLESPDTQPEAGNWNAQTSITFPEKDFKGVKSNRNLVSDTFSLFYSPVILETGEFGSGDYFINVTAATRSMDDPLDLVESDYVLLNLLTNPNSAGFSTGPLPGYLPVLADPNDIDNILGFDINSAIGTGEEARTLADRLESGETIAFGLALLLPPLLLAGAIGLFMGPKPSIGEEALRENFYAQCYYFAPVGLAFWAWYYSLNFYTYDIQYRGEWLWIPLVLALLWFIVVEIYSIADLLPSKSKPGAFLLLSGCIVAMFLVVRLGQAFALNYDWLRKAAIWSYPAITLLLVLGVIYMQFFRRKKGRKG